MALLYQARCERTASGTYTSDDADDFLNANVYKSGGDGIGWETGRSETPSDDIWVLLGGRKTLLAAIRELFPAQTPLCNPLWLIQSS